MNLSKEKNHLTVDKPKDSNEIIYFKLNINKKDALVLKDVFIFKDFIVLLNFIKLKRIKKTITKSYVFKCIFFVFKVIIRRVTR